MEQIAQVIFNGVVIGILLSAPMGPVGMLIIQRTLNKGRWPAFVTGIGAGISDLVYCLLTGLGLSFITDFIEANQLLLQLLGSVVLAAFGWYIFSRNPVRAMKKSGDKSNTYIKDLGTGFLFTFSNPLILFLVMGLFGRFNFLLPEFEQYHYVIGFTSIMLGALLWWFFITYIISKLRSHFNVRSMWVLNRVIGSILMIMALVGIYKSVSGLVNG